MGSLLDSPKATFEGLMVGPNNEASIVAAKAIADDPGGIYNPLFIYGGTAVGKTHILAAVGRQILEKFPYTRLVSISSFDFISEMIGALRSGDMTDFSLKYRDNCDVLLVDDVQFLAGKERSQEEFLETLKFLHSRGRQIVVTSDLLPGDIEDLDQGLRECLEEGEKIKIMAPGIAERATIVKAKSEQKGMTISDEVAMFIADKSLNIRKLEDLLQRVISFARFYTADIDLKFAEKSLGRI